MVTRIHPLQEKLSDEEVAEKVSKYNAIVPPAHRTSTGDHGGVEKRMPSMYSSVSLIVNAHE